MGKTKSHYAGKKIGIIGLGSIGVRHATHLIKLGVSEIFALRSYKGAIKQLPNEVRNIKQLTDENQFFAQGLDAVIISSPTALHLNDLKKVLSYNIPVLVEKPIFDSIDDAKELDSAHYHLIRVGFCLRFHPITQKMISLIAKGVIGSPYLCLMHAGQFLPSWHPYTDYRNEYFAKKELGGGSLRTLSHEIDLMLHIFGTPLRVHGEAHKLSNLKIDVDDFSYIFGEFPELMCRIELDFLSRKHKRYGSIIGDLGELHYDYTTNSLTSYDQIGNATDWSKELANEDMYTAQLIDFVNHLDGKEARGCNYEEAIKTMMIIHEVDQPSTSWRTLKKP